MKTWVSLLRGINVAGHRKVRMDELRALYESLGFHAVATYIQSGNVVFRGPRAGEGGVAKRIERAIAEALGYPVTVLLRGAGDLERIVDGNPFVAGGVADPSRLHVTFLAGRPAPERARATRVPAGSPDDFRLVGRDAYVHCPGGYGRSKLSNAFFERALSVAATTRNWRTVTTLLEMAREP